MGNNWRIRRNSWWHSESSFSMVLILT